MAPSSQTKEPPQKAGRFSRHRTTCESTYGRSPDTCELSSNNRACHFYRREPCRCRASGDVCHHDRHDNPEQLLQTEVPARIGADERRVVAIGIPIEVLQIERILHKRIGLQEASYRRIKDPPVHVDHSQVIQVLVPGKTAVVALVGVGGPVDDQVAEGVVATVCVAPLAERVIRVAVGRGAGVVGGGNQAAQLVLVPVLELDGSDAAHKRGCGLVGAQRGQVALVVGVQGPGVARARGVDAGLADALLATALPLRSS